MTHTDSDWSVMFNSRVVVFGCGNILIGDDAVGPRVIEALREEPGIPDDVALIDAGTSVRQLLFDLLAIDPKPQRIIIVDATTQHGKEPGEMFEIDIDAMDPIKVNEYSLHMFPTVNLLQGIKENTKVDIRCVVVQTGYIPDDLDETMSPEVEAAVPVVARRVKELCLEGKA